MPRAPFQKLVPTPFPLPRCFQAHSALTFVLLPAPSVLFSHFQESETPQAFSGYPKRQRQPMRNPAEPTAPPRPSRHRPEAAPQPVSRRPGCDRSPHPLPATALDHPGKAGLGASALPGRAVQNLPGREHRKAEAGRRGTPRSEPAPPRGRAKELLLHEGRQQHGRRPTTLWRRGRWRRAGRACLPPSAPPRVT